MKESVLYYINSIFTLMISKIETTRKRQIQLVDRC